LLLFKIQLFIFFFFPAILQAEEPFVIQDIQINGLQRTEPGTVFSYLPIKVGDMMDDDKTKDPITEYSLSAGCTACVALITKDHIICANSGDSRCVMARGNQALEMSEDHKPDNEGEKKRIEEAGGFVEDNRVRGILALSRSIGDLEYKVKGENKDYKKDMITADPEIRI
jgi:hypothetical protein